MRLVSTIDANTIVHNDVTYTAGPDGTFEVPEEVGHELASFTHFDEEWVARERELAHQREEDTDAARQADRLAALEARLAIVEGLLADKPKRTRRTKAEMEAARAAGETEDDEPTADGDADGDE